MLELKVSDLTEDHFRGAWRIKKAIKDYNEDVDKRFKIETVGELTAYFNEENLKARLGVGPKTVKYFLEALNGEK